MTKPSLLRSVLTLFFFSATNSYAAQEICNDNFGAGWDILDNSETTIDINYNFADIGIVTDINMKVDISHTYTGDLTADISSPNGTNVVLFARPNTAAVVGSPYGCSRDDIDVEFDDDAPPALAPLENFACAGPAPVFDGIHQPHGFNDGSPVLAAFNGENPTGNWQFHFIDPIGQDTGRMNEACLVVSAAAVTFDQWISTNATCTDKLDIANVATGTGLFVCYEVSNPGDEEFTVTSWTDSLGNLPGTLAADTTYSPGEAQTLSVPYTAGTAPMILGTTIHTSEITVDYTAGGIADITTNETITANVSNAPPSTADKKLYFYNNLSLSRNMPTAQADVQIDEGAIISWTLAESLATGLSITGGLGATINLELFLREQNNGNVRNMSITLSGSSSGTIATNTAVSIGLTGTSTSYTVPLTVTGATSFLAGEDIVLTIQNTTTGSGNRLIQLDPSNGTVASHSFISLPSNNIINVDNINVYDAAFPATSLITSAAPGETVFIRATVSDPFGSFDINSASIVINNPTPAVTQALTAMTMVSDSGVATKIFEFTYAIPNNFSPLFVAGNWDFRVTAIEGLETPIIDHTNFINFPIAEPPVLTVLKSASAGPYNPGSTITYTINVTNTGAGTAQNVVLNDTLNTFTDLNTGSFSCTSGCPGSGVTLGTPTFTTDGSGDVTIWNLIMGGTLNSNSSAPNNNFIIQYTADIE